MKGKNLLFLYPVIQLHALLLFTHGVCLLFPFHSQYATQQIERNTDLGNIKSDSEACKEALEILDIHKTNAKEKLCRKNI